MASRRSCSPVKTVTTRLACDFSALTHHTYAHVLLSLSCQLRQLRVPHHEQVAHNLLEARANVNHENFKHVTALSLACEDRHDECAVLLLRAGARADIADDWGDTPLSIAEKKGMGTVLALMQ